MHRQRGPATATTPPYALGAGRMPDSRTLAVPRTDASPEKVSVVSAALRGLSERAFQAHIRGYLEQRKWVVWVVPNMKLTTAGLPDLLFWHPARPGRLFAWELKREVDYRVTPAQRRAIDHLATVPGIDARIVRPSQWPALRDLVLEHAPAPTRCRRGDHTPECLAMAEHSRQVDEAAEQAGAADARRGGEGREE